MAIGEIKIKFYGEPELTAEEKKNVRKEIKDTILNQHISFNDISCKYTSWDYKLPCGLWVENIYWTSALRTVSCMVWGGSK